MSAPDPMEDSDPRTEIRTPPNLPDRAEMLRPLWHSAFKDPRGASVRREATRYDPLRFAITYLSRYLRAPETDWLTSFSIMHVDMAESASYWAADVPEPVREAWIAPRFSGKSQWAFLILPLWALAHGHRRYVYALSHTRAQAESHLANVRSALVRCPLLVHDFPELAPANTPGAKNTARDLWFAGGGAFSARGMDMGTLGAVVNGARPDLMVFDDIEPGASRYSAEAKDKRLATLRFDILPMNDQAVVWFVGTVTMWGAIMHDLVRYVHRIDEPAAWIREERVVPHYYPPIWRDPRTGREHSCWPERWSIEELQHERAQGGMKWALKFTNLPPRPGEDGVGWTPDLFVREEAPVVGRELFVDAATKTGARNDFTGIQAAGLTSDRRRMVLAYSVRLKRSPESVREEVHRLCRNRSNAIRKVTVEGSETWRAVLSPMPPGSDGRPIPLEIVTAHASKHDRHMDLLDLYQRLMILHPNEEAVRETEREMLEFPGHAHDDMIDSVALAAGKLLEGQVRL